MAFHSGIDISCGRERHQGDGRWGREPLRLGKSEQVRGGNRAWMRFLNGVCPQQVKRRQGRTNSQKRRHHRLCGFNRKIDRSTRALRSLERREKHQSVRVSQAEIVMFGKETEKLKSFLGAKSEFKGELASDGICDWTEQSRERSRQTR